MDDIELPVVPVRLSASGRVQRRLARRVTDALGAEKYRLTVMRDGKGINLTRPGKGQPEALVSADELPARLPQLAGFNANGWQVYITPISQTHHFLVLDDLHGEDGLSAFEQRGYTPVIVQQTSPGNRQAIVKVPKEPGFDYEREVANSWVRQLNQQIGDPKFTGAVHPFRLAGFTNRKAAYEQSNGHFPFVRLERTGTATCEVAGQELARLREEVLRPPSRDTPRTRDARELSMSHSDLLAVSLQRPKALESELAELYPKLRQARVWAFQTDYPGKKLDNSRVDFTTARALWRRGFSVEQAALALELFSPDLKRRHPRTWAYAALTTQRAFEPPSRSRKKIPSKDKDKDRDNSFDIDI